MVGDRPAFPEETENLQGLVGPGAALGDRHADGVELAAELAADADADADPATGPGVEVGKLLGHDHRVVQRQQEDGGADPHAFGPRGQQRETGDRLAGRARRQDVAARPDRIDRQTFGGGQPVAVRLRDGGRTEDDAIS